MTPRFEASRPVTPVPRLYAILDQTAYAPRVLDAVAEELAQAGVEWVQLRAKALSDRELHRLVEATVRRLEGTSTKLWINDRADLAACFGDAVAGLHLGQRDLPPGAARSVLGAATWIGASTHDLDQVASAVADPAVDLIAVGPVFPTASKEHPDPVVGLDLVRRARALVSQPLVAIGGIDAANAGSVLEAGADSVAVIGALARHGSVAAAARELQRALDRSPRLTSS
jgi:thiamine-phosphate pyrophosphorylase